MTDISESNKMMPPKMLIADDDPAILNLLADRCTKMGFSVETAANGMQLLIKARQCRPDIIITDVHMPEVDGLSVSARVIEAGGKAVSVVVIAGKWDAEAAARCDSLGLFYASKGFEFWKSIETALVELFPDMSRKITGLEVQSKNMKVHECPRVLLVDDDPAQQHFLTSRLAKFGVETLYASDVLQGYRIASRSRPSAIITDYYMPNGDALYLLSRLRSNEATGDIPVIVLSGYRLDETTTQRLRREICGRSGAAHILTKSFDTNELFNTLKKYCTFEMH
jgi:CheY-like chemotaxis protein